MRIDYEGFIGVYKIAIMHDPSISLKVLMALEKLLASFGYVLCTECSASVDRAVL